MSMKHVHQKQRIGRTFLKETFFIPFFVLSFATLIITSSNKVTKTAKVYELHELPPLSSQDPWGIFSPSAKGNTGNSLARTLYYSPSGHPGVESLIASLVAANPSIDAVAATDSDDVIAQYGANFFDTWGAIEFSLTQDQLTSGLLVTSETDPTSVAYTILINPFTYPLSTVNYTSVNFNDQSAAADAYWSNGYMTLQNFVSTYLARQYSSVADDFSVETLVQRYPKSPVYENDPVTVDMANLRWTLWRWLAPTMLCICVFIPMLGLLTEAVRERQYKMKDLLEISGLMNSSYWSSYVVTLLLITQCTIWFCCLVLWGFGIFNSARVQPYAALLTVFCLGLSAFSMLGGFVIFRSEYYGLPIFIVNTALTIAGCFLSLDYGTSIGAKLVIAFFHPSLAFTLGIMSIECYLHHNAGEQMDYSYADTVKNYPSLNSLIGVMLLTTLVYYLIVLGMPFDWIQRSWNAENNTVVNAVSKEEQVKYPCDNEELESTSATTGVGSGASSGRVSPSASGAAKTDTVSLLKVQELSHVYPDGTRAVSDMTFHIKQGEVLSFLGANGAGKSTTMGMLCGTLDATFGDAMVNGYSITTDRTSARRNLGIAMQQDIIWNDVSVEDHLYLFGSLRGLHGAALKADVDKMVESLGFPEKRKSLAGTLSGGQKRRLCVGISMVGGNSVVYLDEPTAGLDPVSRRQLWELVQRNRQGRAILLTTHFMDEADVLGDRIAIVKEGRLRALGSSKFLKKRFGLGYLLRMSLTSEADFSALANKVTSFVPQTSVASQAGTELSLRLPKEAVSVFPELFESLEKQGAALGMLSYGIETTTLEEVFMRIVNEDSESLLHDHDEANRLLAASAEEREAHQRALQKRDNQRNPLPANDVQALLTKGDSRSRFTGQVRIMMLKRYHQFVRSKGQWSLGVVCPFLFAIAVGSIINSMPTTILAPSGSPTYPTFANTLPTATPLAGAATASESTTEALFTDAFGTSTPYHYIAGGYQALFSEVQSVAHTEEGNSSVAGVYFENQNNFTVMYNASYPIDFAGAVTNMLNAATSAATGDLLQVQSSFQNLPMTLLGSQLNDSILSAILLSLFVGAIGAGLSIVVGGERVQLVKHQQLASGASKLAYWTANFLFDLLLMFCLVLMLATLLAIFSGSYTGSGYGVVVGGGIPFILASIFRFYCISFWVDDIRMAQTVYFYGSLFTMFALYTLWIVVVFIVDNLNAAGGIAQLISGLATVVDPTFGYFIIIIYQHNFLAVKTLNGGKSVLEDIAGVQFGLLWLDIFLYAFVLWRLEWGTGTGCCSSRVTPTGKNNHADHPTILHSDENDVEMMHDEPRPAHPAPRSFGGVDPDVANEREKVRRVTESGTMSAAKNAIFISQLKKIYFGKGSVPAKVAVKDVSISIPHGEVFGLLGANGAGKTTLLKMVSGQEKPTSGFALINGYDVERQTSEAQRSMGLCPQFDTLVERLSVKENLLFFGQIKGLTGSQLLSVCEAFMVAMNIKRYQHKLIQQLSGGNRRKVSLAVALLGAPPTVYLDEPSTGLDPVASRLMWRLLSKVASARSTAIVLTTHNMLECEAVCTRICIMKMGAMVCLGDSQHLRSVHGTGFLLEMTLVNPTLVDAAKQFVRSKFAGATVVDEHATMINFEIPKASIDRLSAAFRMLEQYKESLGVVDYALSQSTLEQVFLKQIRPNAADTLTENPDALSVQRKPAFRDYLMGYTVWLAAALVPGLHHFYLGNRMRGLKYLLTLNEAYAGWVLDLFEMHVLIQQSVQEHGHTSGCCAVSKCCSSCCCGGNGADKEYDGVLKESA